MLLYSPLFCRTHTFRRSLRHSNPIPIYFMPQLVPAVSSPLVLFSEPPIWEWYLCKGSKTCHTFLWKTDQYSNDSHSLRNNTSVATSTKMGQCDMTKKKKKRKPLGRRHCDKMSEISLIPPTVTKSIHWEECLNRNHRWQITFYSLSYSSFNVEPVSPMCSNIRHCPKIVPGEKPHTQ